MSDDAKVPLPASTAAWVDDPQHPMSSPGDPMRRWTGDYTADDMRAYGDARERAARAAAFREAAEVCQQRKYPEHEADMDAECSAYNSGCEDCADALRARAEVSNG